jgi:hypothetical protein
MPFNLSGHPAVVIPIGQTSDGLPIGMQIIEIAMLAPTIPFFDNFKTRQVYYWILQVVPPVPHEMKPQACETFVSMLASLYVQ